MIVLTCREMRLVEASAVAEGLDYLRLMENAGSAAARIIRTHIPLANKRAVVLCGRGNNGGDGFVIARKLLEANAEVTAVMVCGEPDSLEAREMLSRIRQSSVSILSLESEPYVVSSTVKDADLIIDAVYGIGFHGELPDHMRPLFRLVNSSASPKVAIDIPSGVDGDTGMADADAICADFTITFTAMKPGLLNGKSASHCGDIEVASIGIEERLIDQYASSQTIIDQQMVAACFPPRPLDSHKGTFGHLLTLCGCYGMAGAAALSIKAAQRCGTGLVTAALPHSVYPIVASQIPEAVFLPLPENAAGKVGLAARKSLREKLASSTALLMGCGLGTDEDVRGVVKDMLGAAACPIVLDADGINCIAGHIDIGKTVQAPLVLTPHPGEMARLMGCTISRVQDDRIQAAKNYAEKTGAVVVLKGHKTVIAAPGRSVMVNMTGNPGMATAGSGDVLAGMIASFMAQGMEPYHAAMCGVYLHGLAGDHAAARLSQHAMLPTDMLDELGALFLDLEK